MRFSLCLIAALSMLVTGQLSSSESCYWTSTVLYGEPATWISFSGMTIKTTSQLLSISATSTPATQGLSSTTASTTTTSRVSVPTDPLQPLYITIGNPNSRLRQRAIRYVAFEGNASYLVDIQENAAVFMITSDGSLTSGGQYVGSSNTVGTLSLQKLSQRPDEAQHWTNHGSSITLENASFCYTADEQFFVVYEDEPTQGCVEVALIPEVAPEVESTTYMGWTTTTTALSITSANSVPISSSVSTQLLPNLTMTTPLNIGPFPDTTVVFDTPRPAPSTTSPASFLSGLSTLSGSTLPAISSISTTEMLRSSSVSSIYLSSHWTSRSTTSVYVVSSGSSSLPSVVVTLPTINLPSSATTQVITNTVLLSSVTTTTTHVIASSVILASSSTTITSSTTMLSSRMPTQSNVVGTTSTSPTTITMSSITISSMMSYSSIATATISMSTITLSSRTSTDSSTIVTTSTTISSTSKASSSTMPSTSVHPAKRGIPYNNVNTTHFYPPPTFVSWAYNYYSLPNGTSNQGTYPYSTDYPLIYYPTLFNAQTSLTSIWAANVNYSIVHYGTDAIFSFNEPDACYKGLSSCMSVANALAAYRDYIQPFAGRVRLIAPSVTNAGGLTWLSQFLGNATQMNLTIDVINVHWYASPYNMVYFIDYMKQAYALGNGRPLWITEYGMDKDNYAEKAVQAFIKNTTVWCDEQPWIEKYAWFGNYANKLLNANGTNLSAQGQIYSTYAGGYVYSFT